MFKSVLVLGHVRGIRIEIHASWLVIFVLLMASLGAGLRQAHPDWPMMVVMTTTLATVLAFFASIVAHELGHSLVAIRRGVPVQAITLFIFGGVAQLGRDSESANDEFWIAVAGPVVSFALAVIFGILSLATAAFSDPLSVGLGWLALINLVVAIFNLIPGFPLDGGRVFRALVWKYTGDARKGMNAAVMGGRLVAYLLFAVGLWNVLAIGNLIGGLWIMVIAWFLLTTAEASGKGYHLRQRLQGLRARDFASRDVPMVEPGISIQDWIDHHVLPQGNRSCLVGEGDQVLGLVTLSDIRRIPRDQWTATPIADAMTPSERLIRVTADTSADDVLQLVNEHNLNQVPVMDGDGLHGWIDRSRLLRSLELHLELNRNARG